MKTKNMVTMALILFIIVVANIFAFGFLSKNSFDNSGQIAIINKNSSTTSKATSTNSASSTTTDTVSQTTSQIPAQTVAVASPTTSKHRITSAS